MKLKSLNSHIKDYRISLDEETHTYYVNGNPYDISVTSFIHQFFEIFDENDVINKNYDKWQIKKHPVYYGLKINEIKEMWEKNRKKAAYLGNLLHKDIELFYNEINTKNDSIEFNFFLNFHKRVIQKLVPFRTEWQIFDEEHKIAGSIDMVYSNTDKSIVLCDWKRSKKIEKENKFQNGKTPISHVPDSNYWHYSLQLNIYKYIIEKNYSLKVSNLILVFLHPDQTNYLLIKVPNLMNEVKQMLTVRKLDLLRKN